MCVCVCVCARARVCMCVRIEVFNAISLSEPNSLQIINNMKENKSQGVDGISPTY